MEENQTLSLINRVDNLLEPAYLSLLSTLVSYLLYFVHVRSDVASTLCLSIAIFMTFCGPTILAGWRLAALALRFFVWLLHHRAVA